MSVYEELISNKCTWCLEHKIENAGHIDIRWRDQKNKGYWPKPYQESRVDLHNVKAMVIGQDPTIEDPRPMEYALEADRKESNLGKFLREVFGEVRGIGFDELYFTNLVKCRFDEKPGKGNRNISQFIYKMACECYSKFLSHEMRECTNARYLFTLGRDNFTVLAKLLGIGHPPLAEFKNFYGTGFEVPAPILGKACYVVPLPHQPTYNLAERYSPYRQEEVARKLERLP
jgi:uracil-DNA glycosylase